MSGKPYPFIPLPLLEALKGQYPDRSPDVRWTDREVWFKAGQASVVRFLEAKSLEQQNNILEGNLYVSSTEDH